MRLPIMFWTHYYKKMPVTKIQLNRNKKIIITLSLVFLFVISCLLLARTVLAQDNFWSASQHLTNIARMTDLGGGDVDMASTIGVIINGVLGFLGIACMIFIIYGGFRLMMAGGNDEVVQEARAIIKWALIGLIVVIGAYALSYYVVSQVLKTTAPPARPEIPEEGNLVTDCLEVNCGFYNNQEDCLSTMDSGGQVCCRWDSNWTNFITGAQGGCFSRN
jgi:hypothetical protein